MKKLIALFLTLIICATSLSCLVAYAQDDVIFEGNFEDLNLVVNQGQMSDIKEGITAKDAATNEDLTSEIKVEGLLDFAKEGKYTVMYKIEGKTTFKTRVVNIVKSSSVSNLVHRESDHGRNYFQTPDFESVIGTTRKLIYELYTDNKYTKLKYSWTLNGKEITENYPSRFDVNIFNDCDNAQKIKKAVGKVTYKIISFSCGEISFPAPAELLFYVGDTFENKVKLYLYQYTDDKLVLVSDNIEVNGAGYIPGITLTKGGDYVLTDKKAGYNETSSEETSSKVTSSTPTSSEETSSLVSSSEPQSSEIISSEVTSSEITSSEITSSETVPSDSPDVSTVLLVIILAAFGLMLVTIIAFAIVRKNA